MLSVTTLTDSASSDLDWDDILAVMGWARPILDRGRSACGGLLPRFGSAEWLALPLRHPARWAAVVAAAVLWLLDRQPDVLAERLRREMDEQDRAVLDRWKDTACDVSGASDWSARANEPSHAVLQRRRAFGG